MKDDTRVHKEVRNGLTIKIYQDQDAETPDAFGDNSLFLVGYHHDFTVYGPKDKRGYLVARKDEMAKIICGEALDQDDDTGAIELLEKHHVFLLSAYIHSGVKLYLGDIICAPFDTPSSSGRGWNTSLLGAVLVSKKEWADADQAEKAGQGLVDTWNDALSGNVYGFAVEDQAGEHVDSCWGFYGDYDKDGGALIEARSIVDHLTNKGMTDHHGQFLMPFMATA